MLGSSLICPVLVGNIYFLGNTHLILVCQLASKDGYGDHLVILVTKMVTILKKPHFKFQAKNGNWNRQGHRRRKNGARTKIKASCKAQNTQKSRNETGYSKGKMDSRKMKQEVSCQR